MYMHYYYHSIRYYSVHLDDLTTNTSFDLTTNVTRITISNIQPFFTYNCTVAAFTVGLGPISNPVVVTLPQDGKENELDDCSCLGYIHRSF